MSTRIEAAAAALADLSRIAHEVNTAGWQPALRKVATKTLRTVYEFSRQVGFGSGANDPSCLVEAVADELAERERRAAHRRSLARRRERGANGR